MWAAGTGASLSGIGWANAAVTAGLTGMASNAAVSTINNRGNLGAVLKDVTSNEAMRGYVVAGVTAGLTTGAVTTAGGLNTWGGVGRFTGNQLLQNGTSTLVDRALGGDSKFSDALRTSLAIAFAAAGFNWVGDKTSVYEWDWKNGSLPKIGLHALMWGLAAEAAGGDFKTGALAAGLNEAIVDKLADVYGHMDVEEKKRLLVMNSQVLGVLAAAAQGGDEKSLQTGAWVAATATSYNNLDHPSADQLLSELKDCHAGNQCSEQKLYGVIDKYEKLSAARSNAIESCTSRACVEKIVNSSIAMDDPVAKELLKRLYYRYGYNVPGLLNGNPDGVAVPSASPFKGHGDLFTLDKQLVLAKYLREGWLTPQE